MHSEPGWSCIPFFWRYIYVAVFPKLNIIQNSWILYVKSRQKAEQTPLEQSEALFILHHTLQMYAKRQCRTAYPADIHRLQPSQIPNFCAALIYTDLGLPLYHISRTDFENVLGPVPLDSWWLLPTTSLSDSIYNGAERNEANFCNEVVHCTYNELM